jgi:hypothetical protein
VRRADYIGPDTEPEEWAFPVPQREFYLVSSPMTGRPDLHIPVIRKVITVLARTGIVAYNPFADQEPEALMKYDPHYFTSQYIPVATHPRCAGVIMLPGWTASDGATTETILAVRFDKPLFEYRVYIDSIDGHAHPYLQQIERSVTIS